MPALIAALPILPAASVQSMTISPVGTITPDGGNGSPIGYTPQQVRTAYGFNQIAFGSIAGDGAGQTIAIVDAYDDPGLVSSTAAGFSTSDLAEFDRQFNLPDPPSFIKMNQDGSTTGLPATDPAGPGSGSGNWEYEEAMDVEWAHALAPAANIVLVETNTNNDADLYAGINTAENLPGVSTISLSWGSGEYSGETYWDQNFQTPARPPGGDVRRGVGRRRGAGALSGLFAERRGGRRHDAEPQSRRLHSGRVGLVQWRRRDQLVREGTGVPGRRRRARALARSPTCRSSPTAPSASLSTTPTTTPAAAPGPAWAARAWRLRPGPR